VAGNRRRSSFHLDGSILKESAAKQCELDPLPAHLVQIAVTDGAMDDDGTLRQCDPVNNKSRVDKQTHVHDDYGRHSPAAPVTIAQQAVCGNVINISRRLRGARATQTDQLTATVDSWATVNNTRTHQRWID